MADQIASPYHQIGELVRRLETNYVYGTTIVSKYVSKSMYDDLQKIDAYLNSKHTSGETDSLGREKPFFNIVTSAVNIWYRATDIDRKNIQIKPSKVSDTFLAFLATVHVQDWMRRARFGYFLNTWGRTLAKYGSAPVKFVEQDGELKVLVVPWNRMICDVVDFDANPKIEMLELTEAQLRQNKSYDQEMIDKLVETRTARQLLTKQRQDRNNDYIKLYEIHGLLPLSYLTGKEADRTTYVQQMHVISYIASKQRGEYDDFTLFSGQEEKDPYMITHLIEEDGQTLSIGAVQHLFEAQWMLNHTTKAIKDQLDLTSKIIFQTSDTTFVSQNALTAIENGEILIHKPNEPVSRVDNTAHDVSALQAFGTQWKAVANEINGISEAMQGVNPTSGTPWRTTNQLLEENHALFGIMTQNKGLHVEDMFRTYILPFLKKKMAHTKEITATLDSYHLSKVDRMYVSSQATKKTNQSLIKSILAGGQPTQVDQQSLQTKHSVDLQGAMADLGNERFFAPSEIPDKTWKEVFKDLEWDLIVDITGEATPDKDDLQTLTTVLQTIGQNPRVLFDPNAKLIFNKILGVAGGISPLELTEAPPVVPLPNRRFTETLDYKDAPEDIKRQMEAQQGFTPSQLPPPNQAPTPSPQAPSVVPQKVP